MNGGSGRKWFRFFRSGSPVAWTFVVIAYLGVSALLLINRSAWVDEGHFVAAIRFFGSTPLTESLRDYPEVTPPLFYLAYAAWGHVFGFGLIPLRLLSLLIAASALFVLHRLARRHLAAAALPVCALLLLNPYLPGAAVFVFTDMSALLCVLLALWSFASGRRVGAALALSAALLIRQYTVVFWAALGVVALAEWLRARASERPRRARTLFAFAAAPAPLALFVAVWGGLAPPSGRALWIVGDGPVWNPSAFTAYVAFLAVYLIPVLIAFPSFLRGTGRLLPVAIPAAVFYGAFPVVASETARAQAGVETVGLMHRALRALTGPGMTEHLALTAAFCAGVFLLSLVVRDDIRLWKTGAWGAQAPLSLSLYFFLVVMPLSYQIWEKYLLLVLPVAAIRIALIGMPDASPLRRGKASPEPRRVPLP